MTAGEAAVTLPATPERRFRNKPADYERALPVDIIDGLHLPWRWLVAALLLALLALGFFVMARRSYGQSIGWLLSGCVAGGFATAALYNFVDAAVTPAFPGAGVVVLITILRFVLRGATQQRTRR